MHLGYYERGHDFEAIALKVSGGNTWHVFFPFDAYGLPVPSAYSAAPEEEDFGTLILAGEGHAALQQTFIRWAEEKLLPLLNLKV